MFVYKTNPVGIELFSHVKTFFYSTEINDLDCVTSSFYNKRLRQVSHLIAFFP